MRSVFAFVILFFLSDAQAVINGVEATRDDLIAKTTVEVLVVNDSVLIGKCSGTLISNHLVLTAAHCFAQPAAKVLIGFGLHKQDLTQADLRPVDVIRVYQGFKSHASLTEDNLGDIALLHFTGDLADGYTTAVVDASSIGDAGSPIGIAGYGADSYIGVNGFNGGILRYGQTLISNPKLSQTEFSTGNSATLTCYGDSGGPAYISNGTEILVQGVVMGHFSESHTGGDPGCTGFSKFTRVSAYFNWIKKTAAELDRGASRLSSTRCVEESRLAPFSTVSQS